MGATSMAVVTGKTPTVQLQRKTGIALRRRILAPPDTVTRAAELSTWPPLVLIITKPLGRVDRETPVAPSVGTLALGLAVCTRLHPT